MNKLVIAMLFALIFVCSSSAIKAADCPKALEVKCVDDIRAGIMCW